MNEDATGETDLGVGEQPMSEMNAILHTNDIDGSLGVATARSIDKSRTLAITLAQLFYHS